MKLNLKSFMAGVIAATVGVTTVFAAGGIKTAEFNQNKVFFDGTEINLSAQPMISVVKEGETSFSNYMPVRALLEAMGYAVEWDEAAQAVKINTKSAAVAEAPDTIAGYWIAETDEYKIQYHFHEDGHYHAHTELHKSGGHDTSAVAADTFADGTYAVTGNSVVITVNTRITDCENEELKKTLEETTEIKFTYEFASDGESWTASVEGFGTVKFVKDTDTEDWAEEHIAH